MFCLCTMTLQKRSAFSLHVRYRMLFGCSKTISIQYGLTKFRHLPQMWPFRITYSLFASSKKRRSSLCQYVALYSGHRSGSQILCRGCHFYAPRLSTQQKFSEKCLHCVYALGHIHNVNTIFTSLSSQALNQM